MGNSFDINKERANNTENWQVNKIFYYEVNGRKFYNKSEADEYSLKLFLDNWNVGHHGCTEPTVIDKSENRKYNTIREFCKIYISTIKELFEIADSIDIEKLSVICTEEAINKMALYKSMVEQLKNKIK